MAKLSKEDPQQLKLDIKLMLWLIMANNPFSMVGHPSFHRWCQALNPRYNLKHAITYAKCSLPLVHKTLTSTRNKLLIREIPACKQEALTFDH